MTLYLDTETTGITPDVNRVVEICLVNEDGDTMLNLLVYPQLPIPPEATAIHISKNRRM